MKPTENKQRNSQVSEQSYIVLELAIKVMKKAKRVKKCDREKYKNQRV